MEVAALGLKIEGVEGIDRAAASLDGLAAAGVKAEKSTQGVGKGSAGAKPSVDALAASAEKAAQAEARLATQAEKAGISVGQMKAALRGVPAQFTDIAVSLQGGMSPLTVFLQQGGQLKDMFGGAGSAARALGGYVSGLINPFTVTAAAIAGIGVAYFQGSKEQDAFMVSMAKTGNAVGVTTSVLRSYAEQISATVGTQGKAAESLNIFIDSGVKAGASLARLTETAIAWEKATGEGVDKVAAKYVALQNDPLKAAMKLNEGMNFLTLSVYEQVKSLEEQGRTTDAAKVAMDALDSAMAERSKTIEQNLGSIQRGWNGITGAAKKAWDAMLNVGRPASLNDQLLDVEKQLERLMGQQGFGGTEGGAATGRVSAGQQAKIKESIRLLQEQKAALMGQAEAERWSADATKKNSEAVAAKSAWDKIVASNLSKQEKLELALANVRERAAAAGVTGKELEAQLSAEREKYADKTKKSTAAVTAAKTAYESLIVSINEKISATNSELASGDKQTEADKLRARYQQELTTRSRQFTDAQKKKIEADIAAYDVLEKQLKAARELEKAWADDEKALESYTKKQDDYFRSVSDSVAKMQEEEAGHVLAAQAGISHAQAMQQLTIARLEDARAQMQQGAGSAEEVERINQEIEARKKLLGVIQSGDARKETEKATEDAAKAWQKSLDDAQKAAEKTSQMIGDTLSDYIMGGGKDAAQYLKRLFATLVLQPIVQYGVNSAMGALGVGQQGSAVQSVLGGNNVGTTVLNNAGLIGAGYQAAFGASVGASSASLIGANAVGAVGGDALGALIATNGGWAGVSTGAAVGSTAVGGAGAAGAGSLMTGVMAAAPYLAAIVALYAIISGMDDSGTPHFGAGSVYSKATGIQEGADIYNQNTFGMGHRDEYSAEMQAGISGIAQGLGQTLDAFAVSFGKTAGYSVATAFADDSSDDGSWGSLKIMDQLGNKLVDWSDNRASKWAPREFADGKEGYEEYLKAVAVDVKAAFLAMDLPGWADQALKTATDIDTLNAALQEIATVKSVLDGLGMTMGMFADISGELQTRLLSASGGVEALGSNAGAFYESFFTEQDRMLKQRELQMQALGKVGLYIDPAEGDAAKETFRKTVEEAMGSGQVELAAQLLAMSGAFASTADYAQGVNEQLEETARSWIQLGHSLSIFSDISFATRSALIEAAGGFDVLQSSANDFYQGFYSATEKALNDRDLMMRSLSDSGLYIDPAEGNAAKELFRKTVEEAMSSGQTQLAAELLNMSGLFAQTADYAQQVAEDAAQKAKEMADGWISLSRTMELFSGLSAGMQTALLAASESMAELTSNASDFNQGFYSEQERALRQRESQMAALAGMGLYIDPAEGEKAKELFRKTVEEAMSSGQAELAAKLLAMSGDFAATADYAKQFFDQLAQSAVQSMSTAWSSFTTVAGLAAQYNGNTSGLTAQLGVVRGSYENATTTEGRVGALQQIISLEQGLFNAQEQARQAEVQAATARANAAREQLNSANQLLGAAKGLGDYVKQLRFSEASGLSEAQRATALQKEYNSLLSRAQGGDINAMQDLQSVSSSYLTLAEQMSGTQQDYTAISTRMAAELAATAAIQEAAASSQVARLEQQIAFAEATATSVAAQFKVSEATQKLIDDLLIESATAFEAEASLTQKLIDQGAIGNNAIMSLPAELAGAIGTTLLPAIRDIAYVMAQAAGIDGSHAGGLASVPFNGYRAILHKDEAVLTAEENRAYRSGSSSGSTTSVSNEVLSVLLGIKNDNRLMAEQGLSLQLRIARRLDDWNGNGLPATRKETA